MQNRLGRVWHDYFPVEKVGNWDAGRHQSRQKTAALLFRNHSPSLIMLERIVGRLIGPLLLRRKISRLGQNARTAGYVSVFGGKNVAIGDDFFCGRNFYVSTSAFAKVTIGHAVMLGPEVMFLGGDHDFQHFESHMRFHSVENSQSQDIVVEDGAWLGARCVVLSGASIGEGAVVGAASVIRKHVPPYSIAVGNQLRIVAPRFKRRSQLEQMLKNVQSRYSLEEILQDYARVGLSVEND